MAQIGLEDLAPELIVVDNSPDLNARALVASLAEKSPFPLHYVSERRPGVANARNAGVAVAQGRWVAFLDDDEEADPCWLASLARVARERGAAAVFGSIEARAESGTSVPSRPFSSAASIGLRAPRSPISRPISGPTIRCSTVSPA